MLGDGKQPGFHRRFLLESIYGRPGFQKSIVYNIITSLFCSEHNPNKPEQFCAVLLIPFKDQPFLVIPHTLTCFSYSIYLVAFKTKL
ncbi:Uncharacterised protein [Mycobacteroides abscessus subsp. abscessus]|nr:Uncharacterised protein [Mycobacteroides abscessus subsp. abscessus]